jgi:hypothetical protein
MDTEKSLRYKIKSPPGRELPAGILDRTSTEATPCKESKIIMAKKQKITLFKRYKKEFSRDALPMLRILKFFPTIIAYGTNQSSSNKDLRG